MIAVLFSLIVLGLILLRDIAKLRKPQPWLVVGIATCFIVTFLNSYVGGVYSVPTGSMEPNLRNGDYTAAVRVGGLLDDGKLMRGDIVVFKAPAVPRTLYIKRLIGIPGDKVSFDVVTKEFRVNGKVLGELVSETEKSVLFTAKADRDGTDYKFLIDKQAFAVKTKGNWDIPAGYFFMAGDNRDHSWDSRYWENPTGTPKPLRGLVSYDRIEARYIFTLFNFNPFYTYDAMDGEMKVFRRSAGETIQ